MARSYRARDDGLFEVETPGLGFVPVHWGEDQLRAQGLEPIAPPEGRLAQVDQSGMGGAPGNVPESATDAGGAWNPSMGGAPGFVHNPNAGTGTQSSTPNVQEDTPMTPTDPNTGKSIRPPQKTEEYRPGGGGAQAAPERPRYSTTKARDVKAAWRVDKGPQLDPENEEFRSEAEIDTRLNMQERADREEARALQNVEEYEKRVLAPQTRQISADELKLDRMRQEYAKRQNEIDTERAAVDKLEVNPDKLFEDRGAWASILAGISIIAGGSLQGLTGRSNNPGLDAVNNAIDRDIQNQKEKIARRKEGLGGKETALEKLMATYGNPEMAEAELRNRQASLAEAWARRHAMQSGAEDVQANLQQAFNERDLARVEERRQLDQAFGDRISESWQHVPAQTVQVGGARAPTKEARQRIVSVDGRDFYARNNEQATAVQDKVKTASDIQNELGELQRLGDEAGTLTSGSPDYDATLGRMRSIAAGLAPMMSVQRGQGAQTDDEFKRSMQVLGDPESIIRGTAKEALKEQIRQQAVTKNAFVRDYLYVDPDATQHVSGPTPRSVRRENE